MATRRRGFGEGSIDKKNDKVYRIRYSIDGRRYCTAFDGTVEAAKAKLRALLKAGDDGEHVEPDKLTVSQWIDQWLDTGCPGRKRQRVGERSRERYSGLLNTHFRPAFGDKQLQRLTAQEIDRVYVDLEGRLAPRTARHAHVVFASCLGAAHRQGVIAHNPMTRVSVIPGADGARGDAIAEGLSTAELARLVAAFKVSSIYPIVALAAATGARRNELLALRWADLDVENKMLRIERALEETRRFGIRVKPPKTQRGIRTIDLDPSTVEMLLAQRERHQRIVAGVPDGADVDLSLVKLPRDSLMFPSGYGEDLLKPKNPREFSRQFAKRARALGFKTRFHDLRGIHATALLDDGVPVHSVAQRIGDSPSVLLRSYTKRTRTTKADERLASALGSVAAGIYGR
jgi:integrase